MAEKYKSVKFFASGKAACLLPGMERLWSRNLMRGSGLAARLPIGNTAALK
jgi:hypothetical protein